MQERLRDRIGALCISEQFTWKELSFEEILLDETRIMGEVWITEYALQEAGGINCRLEEKQEYELLLRIVGKYRVIQCGDREAEEVLSHTGWIRYGSPDYEKEGEGWKTDCYLISRYKKELLDLNCFEAAAKEVLEVGGKDAAGYLELMLTQSETYFWIYDGTQPILIYCGDEICYGMLDSFAEYLGEALRKLGQKIEYFDNSKCDLSELGLYTGRRLKAVIGMQTYLFSVKLRDGTFLHDRIGGRKYNFIFDHPVWMKQHLEHTPQDLSVLTPDGNYAEFIKTYYGLPAYFLPPGGSRAVHRERVRKYGIVFLGSYKNDLLQNLRIVWKADRKRSHRINRWILFMRRYMGDTPEGAFEKMAAYYHVTYTKKEILEWLYRERWVITGLAGYYRMKMIEILLKNQITLDVFGESWKSSSMYGHPGLICHEAAIGKAALEVYANAKLALNIMTWHKDGFTERIANAMLQRAVVITDRTTYLEKYFEDGAELIFYDLEHLEKLPGKVQELLADESKRSAIAEKGYQKALKSHTWEQRARELLRLIEDNGSL